jgi:hypothetical protein
MTFLRPFIANTISIIGGIASVFALSRSYLHLRIPGPVALTIFAAFFFSFICFHILPPSGDCPKCSENDWKDPNEVFREDTIHSIAIFGLFAQTIGCVGTLIAVIGYEMTILEALGIVGGFGARALCEWALEEERTCQGYEDLVKAEFKITIDESDFVKRIA